MGESIVENVDPRLGSLGWADWTNRAGNDPLVRGQLTTLLPVQELLPFQRQIVTRSLPIAVPQGEQVQFDATVPNEEAWRLQWMAYFHDDDLSHILVFRMLPGIGKPSEFHQITRMQVREDVTTPLYPSLTTAPLANNIWHQHGGPHPEFFGGDKITVIDETAVNDAAGVTAVLVFRYELIPLPISKAKDTVWGAQTF